MASLAQIEARVRAGITLLDRNIPGWWKESGVETHQRGVIDLRKLNITSGSDCVLGQLFGSFDDGYESLRSKMLPNLTECDYGFDFDVLRDRGILNKLWYKHISERRQNALRLAA